MDATIDILMITYNRPQYTEMSLRRLLDGSDAATRLWIWHNGNDAQTLNVVHSFSDHPRLHQFHHSPENKKLTEPTNWLWTNARGDFFSKVDDDCLLPADWADVLRKAHADEPRFGVIGCSRIMPEDFVPELVSKKTRTYGAHRIMQNPFVQGSGYLMKRGCFDEQGPLIEPESFTQYCTRLADSGWINGWYFPFLHEEHMDDPRTPHSLMKTDADLEKFMPLTAQRCGVTSLAGWAKSIQENARHVQAMPVDGEWTLRRRLAKLRRVVARPRRGFAAFTAASAVGSAIEPNPTASDNGIGFAKPSRVLKLGLFGCPPDTGNLGVSALGISIVTGLTRLLPDVRLTMFDYRLGAGAIDVATGNATVRVTRVGCWNSRRYYQPGNLPQMLLAARMGLGSIHPMLRRMREFDAILDISGGDSFADLYGPRRFQSIALPKLTSLQLGVPLILMPQTYGPYSDPDVKAVASRILRGAKQAWARDEQSMRVVRELLGDKYDPRRHRGGVDVAFGLPITKPAHAAIADAIFAHKAGGIMVGLNISGLLYNRPGDDVAQYGFKDGYRQIVHDVAARLLEQENVRLLLIPHVTAWSGGLDCDVTAIDTFVRSMPEAARKRMLVVPGTLTATEAKWVIGQCDWFCGTRMHATIAALSQGIPTAAIAYSDKTAGVFETVGVGGSVVDPRRLRAGEIVERIRDGFLGRAAVAASLGKWLPDVQRRLDEQFAAMIASLM